MAWNPSDKSSGITLSVGNTVATTADASAIYSVRGTTSRSTGKYMVSFSNVVLTDLDGFVGVGDGTVPLGTASGNQGWAALFPGGAGVSAYFFNKFNYYQDGPVITTSPFTLDICVDFGGLLAWVRVNGGNWNGSGGANPATGSGGHPVDTSTAKFPMVALHGTGATATINTNPSSPPSGFVAWDSAPVPKIQAAIVN